MKFQMAIPGSLAILAASWAFAGSVNVNYECTTPNKVKVVIQGDETAATLFSVDGERVTPTMYSYGRGGLTIRGSFEGSDFTASAVGYFGTQFFWGSESGPLSCKNLAAQAPKKRF
ncbi:hypothetical protein K2X30_15570 [bacterium]|jgi:hypothetical protein|nr:hypothetical protein [bacterium]